MTLISYDLFSGKLSRCVIGCVVLYVNFNTFAECLEFLHELLSNKITEYFQPVQKALRKRLSLPDLVLNAVMNEEQFTHCMDNIGKHLKCCPLEIIYFQCA